MISQRVLAALTFSEANFKSTNEMFLIGAKRERSRTAAIEQAIAKVVEAAEKALYSDVLPYHLDDPIAEALSELERALKDCGV